MIRNVVLGRMRELDDPVQAAAASAQLDEGLAGIAALTCPGLVAMHVGRDAGLRDGTWTFAITNDWVDADAYRGYDTDPEHNRFRRLLVEVCSDLARVQVIVDH